jgi:hypothetical protein
VTAISFPDEPKGWLRRSAEYVLLPERRRAGASGERDDDPDGDD